LLRGDSMGIGGGFAAILTVVVDVVLVCTGIGGWELELVDKGDGIVVGVERVKGRAYERRNGVRDDVEDGVGAGRSISKSSIASRRLSSESSASTGGLSDESADLEVEDEDSEGG
jgi:hypothetical protein